mmetsp:Transcript_150478/g.262954  ORF Transcript_150478/g.262954 Transcript_150478/m.262954 type:complete len:85 (+) Transcript_150478:1084-1338(+)
MQRHCLRRKGDRCIVFSHTLFALMLPSVCHTMGGLGTPKRPLGGLVGPIQGCKAQWALTIDGSQGGIGAANPSMWDSTAQRIPT